MLRTVADPMRADARGDMPPVAALDLPARAWAGAAMDPLRPLTRVLIVCIGNVCRSPMAATLWRDRFGDHTMLVQSAGLKALTGHGIDPRSEAMLAAHGLTAQQHVARQLTGGLVDAADVVLVMERCHAHAVQTLSPAARARIFMLGELSGGIEIPDPHQRTQQDYADAYRLIEQAVGDWHERLRGAYA